MAWRTILIQNEAKLTLAKGQLAIDNAQGHFHLPLEDVTVIILDSAQIALTSTLLSACQENGVAVITCDATHMPNGLLLPFHPHSRQSRVAQMQITWSEALKKRLWQKIVTTKIANQARCLSAAKGPAAARKLSAFISQVGSGDPDNIEAQAARDYWPKLFGPGFRRHAPDSINAALNYGYAVLRAFIARAQVAYGLLPCFGFHHAGELNAFNLTDDVMEVLRPSVDWIVFEMLQSGSLTDDDRDLSIDQRQHLAQIGGQFALYNNERHTVTTLSEKLAETLVSAIENKSASLFLMPELLCSDVRAKKS